MFGKLPSEMTPDDLRWVVSERMQEGSQLEFKETLPGKKGRDDPWISGAAEVGDRARNELIEEVVAFANAHGGWLLLGIEETSEKPACANAIVPVRGCADLAERLRLMCRDCIEPKLPVLEVAPVPTTADGAGIVVFHVPKSRMAPHRHTVTKECYIRRADRTEKMTMREIQDLTLQVERGLAAIERQFQKRREQFSQKFSSYLASSARALGLRATLVPLTPIYVERVHGNEAVTPPSHTLWSRFGSGRSYNLDVPDQGGPWRPLVRGTTKSETNRRFASSREVHCDGLIEYVLMCRTETLESGPRAPPFYLPVEWAMGLLGNALCAAEKLRRAAGAPDVEYGLELDVASDAALPIGPYGGPSFGETLGPLPDNTTFPRYSVGAADEFQRVSAIFERDFWNGAGLDPPQLGSVDFERALQELGLAGTRAA